MTAPVSVIAPRSANAASPAPRAAVVPARITALSGDEAAGALARAYEAVVGEPPSPRTLAVLTAQWAHETGRGASMLNFNFGGAKGVGPSGLTVEARTREGWGTSERRIVDRFRAYGSAEEGAADHVRLLERRFEAALSAAQAGDAEAFVRELRAGGYFTGDPAAYARAVSGLAETAIRDGYGALTHGVTPRRLGPAPAGVARSPGPTGDRHPGLVDALPGVDSALAVADELARLGLRLARDDAQERG